jgi:threonine/homoserine/homoserine lactone efflux protein
MFTALLCLGLVFAVMTVAWLVFYAVVISNIGNVLNRPAIRRSIEGVAGVVLIGLGLRVAAEHR